MRDIIKTIKILLCQALGLQGRHNGDRKADFAEFCGSWSKAEAAEFERNTKDFRTIDPRDWR